MAVIYINDKLKTYLEAQHIPGVYASADLPTLIQYDLSLRSGTYTVRVLAMLADAAAS